jgi:hypothetical protein
VEAVRGLTIRHRTTGYVGPIVRFTPHQVTIRDGQGREQVLPVAPGAFSVGGRTVTLVRPKPASQDRLAETRSGSVPAPPQPARVARPSRILVEGRHDAELVEKVWGDDLRAEGVVVEPLHGADDLPAVIRTFQPAPDRRLGVLLDHLVAGSKEWHLATGIEHPDVLITGHPFVDIWEAVKPVAIGLEAWPSIERGTDWKTGVCAELGFRGTPGEMWALLLGKVTTYRDLEPPLVGAVEELIDFVAPPAER